MRWVVLAVVVFAFHNPIAEYGPGALEWFWHALPSILGGIRDLTIDLASSGWSEARSSFAAHPVWTVLGFAGGGLVLLFMGAGASTSGGSSGGSYTPSSTPTQRFPDVSGDAYYSPQQVRERRERGL